MSRLRAELEKSRGHTAEVEKSAAEAVFGNVVSFDTTYRKHKDGLPIALFVGVNNHK